MDGRENNIVVNENTDDVTIKLDSSELERTMRLSDEELQKAVKQVNMPHEKHDDSGNTTSFFSLGKTSSFSSIFEKKRNVEDELALDTDRTSVGTREIDNTAQAEVNLHSLENSFEIISKIGEGGQGVISTAADRSLGRIVALKSLHANLNKKCESREHFIAEAKITAQLDYPGIVPVYSLNNDKDGGLHLAMKFINGENLADHLERIRDQYSKGGIDKFNEALSIRKRIEIFLRSCDAIAYAHSRNVMHCDLKPENIMLGQHNDSYIMDWGIARLIQDPGYDPAEWTRPTTISGTPRYLSPEAIEGVYTDERVDVYALGLILFECVFLKTAFNGKDTKEVIGKVRNGQIEKFTHAFNCPVNKDLSAIIRKAVAFNRDDRYQSVKELADDIRRYLANEETDARPDNIFTKLFRFGQRHIKMLLILVLLWLLIAGGAVSYSVYQRTQHANFILQRDIALNTAYSKALYVSSLIELQMNHVSSSLKTLTAYISFLLNNDIVQIKSDGKYFWHPDEYKKVPRAADIIFSEAYNKYITLDRMSFNHISGKYDLTMLDNMRRLQSLQPFLKELMLEGNVFRAGTGIAKMDKNEEEKYFYKYGSPKLWIYCGFEDGLFGCMPGYLEQPENFDPRKRDWYIMAAGRTPFDGVVWGTPYYDMFSQRLTLTASLPIFVNNELRGVIAIDSMLQYITGFMKKNGNTDAFLLEKVLLDEDGNVLLSSINDYSVKKDGENISGSGDFFEDEYIFDTIRERRNGILNVTTSRGRNIVYLFYCISTKDWHYVEKIDLDMLLDSIEEKKKSKK